MSRMFSINFNLPQTASDLAPYIGIDPESFEKVITSKDRKEFYTPHQIPKRSRHRRDKVRVVWEVVHPRLLQAHKAIARRFELFARISDSRFPHEAAYGYVRHRGTRDNAKIHCGVPLLLRADIHNFFPSISSSRLEERFLELGMHPKAAEALARFVTIDDRLALGLNASPMLANLVCVDLDIKLQELAQAYGCNYTRYADDISISGRRRLPPQVLLERILVEEKFQLNYKKFRQTRIGQAHYVTGLSISDVNGPHVPRQMKRRLRQELYYSEKFGTKNHLKRTDDISLQSGVNRLNGTILYVSHIESRMSDRLKSQWKELQTKDGISASYESLPIQFSPRVTCFVDETEILFRNRKYLALGFAFTEDADALPISTLTTLREHQIEDAFYPGDRDALAKRGLHFTDSHPDLRTAYIKKLSNLPYRGFVIFGKLDNNDAYQNTYVSLLANILPRRLMWYDRAFVRFIFEENSKIRFENLERTVYDAYHLLEKMNNRRPIRKPEITIGKKSQYPCFAVPDYLLAIFSRYAQMNEHPKEAVRLHQFERLRDRYRAIIDADNDTEFSRRRPFEPWSISGE